MTYSIMLPSVPEKGDGHVIKITINLFYLKPEILDTRYN